MLNLPTADEHSPRISRYARILNWIAATTLAIVLIAGAVFALALAYVLSVDDRAHMEYATMAFLVVTVLLAGFGGAIAIWNTAKRRIRPNIAVSALVDLVVIAATFAGSLLCWSEFRSVAGDRELNLFLALTFLVTSGLQLIVRIPVYSSFWASRKGGGSIEREPFSEDSH